MSDGATSTGSAVEPEKFTAAEKRVLLESIRRAESHTSTDYWSIIDYCLIERVGKFHGVGDELTFRYLRFWSYDLDNWLERHIWRHHRKTVGKHYAKMIRYFLKHGGRKTIGPLKLAIRGEDCGT